MKFIDKRNILKFRKHPYHTVKKLLNITIPSIKYNKMRQKYEGRISKLPYPPKYVTIAINGYCMNACLFCSSHCIDSGRNDYTNHQYNIPYELSYEKFCHIVDLCYQAKVPHVHIVAAGEPFLHSDVFKMMDYLSRLYGTVSIQSNFNKKVVNSRNVIKELLNRKLFIDRITTDIFPREIHNIIKKGSNYDYILKVLAELSDKSDIIFDVHTILTKNSYKKMDDQIREMHDLGINFEYNVVNLHPHGFNEFTSLKNVYRSTDDDISKELESLKFVGKELGIKVSIPLPWDLAWEKKEGKCLTFWNRFQVVPDKAISKENWIGNIIPSQCNAVVVGNLSSLGNIFDHKNLMEFWNNEKLIQIRKDIINGTYPDEKCNICYLHR